MGKYDNLPKGFYVDSESGEVNFAKAKELGYKFCLARAADCDQLVEGSWNNASNYVDQKFAEHVQKAYDNGLILGALYRLGTTTDHAVDWKSPGNGLQAQALKKALENKTYHFIVITVPTVNNTDGNMKDYLFNFLNVCSEVFPKVPLAVGTSPDVWGYGNKQIENFIGQEDFPHTVVVLGSRDNFLSPGNLPSQGNLMWNEGNNVRIGDSNYLMFFRYIGSEGLLTDRFGTPVNWDYMPSTSDEPTEPGDEPTEPGDEPTEPGEYTGDIANAINDFNVIFADFVSAYKEVNRLI